MKSRQTPVCRDFPVPVSRANVTASLVAELATNSRSPSPTRGAATNSRTSILARGTRYLLADPNTYAIRFDRKSKPAPGGGNDPIPEPISTSAGPVFSLRGTVEGSASGCVSLRGTVAVSASDDHSAREPASTSRGGDNTLRRTAFGSANEGVSLRGRTTRSASDNDSARETQRFTRRARPAVGLSQVDCGRLAFLREQFGLGATDHKHRDERGSDHGDCGGDEH